MRDALTGTQAMPDPRVKVPEPLKPATFTIEKNGAVRTVTIPAEKSEEELVYGGLPVVTFDMLDGGRMRIK